MLAFTTEIAEPDRDGGALRYRGVDIQDLVAQKVEFGDVWALLVDGRFGKGLPPAEPFPLPVHSGDVRVDVQAGPSPCWRRSGVIGRCWTSTTRPLVADGPRVGDGAVLRRAVRARDLPARGAAAGSTNVPLWQHDS